MATGIYKIKNEITGKVYIGQAVSIPRRWKQHINNYDNKNETTYESQFYRDIRKYGIENYSFSIIELCNTDELDEKEMKWIQTYDSYNSGLNSTIGGSGSKRVDREEFKKYFLENNVSVAELAKHFFIDRSTAGRMLADLNLSARYYVDEKLEKIICDEYLSNRSVSCLSLAKKYKKDRDTVRKILKKHNIKIFQGGSAKAHKITVYDAHTNELLIDETYISDFVNYLKNNGIVENPSNSTIQNHIKRNGNVLYGRYKVCKKG